MDEWMPSRQTEIVIGLVGAAGANLDQVGTLVSAILRHYQYESVEIRLSEFLQQINWGQLGPEESPDQMADRRIWQLMELGTRFREAAGSGDALALVAVNQIVAERSRISSERSAPKESQPSSESQGDPLEPGSPLERTAFILRSLKHPGEVSILRQVYGPRFFLIGAYVPEEIRIANLRRTFADTGSGEDPDNWFRSPSQLVAKDEAEKNKLGQQVRDTFHRADFFVDATERDPLRRALDRGFEILFGNPFRTPTRDEYAMFQAEGSALRSAEPGRQVGAALVNRAGSVLALGTNEVPKFGGGQYWDEDEEDAREFLRDRDTNRVQLSQIAEDILGVIRGSERSRTEGKTDSDLDSNLALEQLLETRLGDITEFGRAVHAEMSAILDAAIRGVAISNSWAYTTTFPCHNCARHLIGAGIERVVYISPYPKSAALDLHKDSMVVDPGEKVEEKVRFEPFVGVAPRRYRQFFSQEFKDGNAYQRSRKSADGDIFKFNLHKANAQPVLVDMEAPGMIGRTAPYQDREQRAIQLLDEVWNTTGFKLKEEDDV